MENISDRIFEILTKSRKPPKVEDCKVARWGDFFLDLTLAEREKPIWGSVNPKYAALLLLLI